MTWIQSYVTPDKRKAFYICDALTPEAIRRAAQRNNLPVVRVTEVRILDPYFLLETSDKSDRTFLRVLGDGG